MLLYWVTCRYFFVRHLFGQLLFSVWGPRTRVSIPIYPVQQLMVKQLLQLICRGCVCVSYHMHSSVKHNVWDSVSRHHMLECYASDSSVPYPFDNFMYRNKNCSLCQHSLSDLSCCSGQSGSSILHHTHTQHL